MNVSKKNIFIFMVTVIAITALFMTVGEVDFLPSLTIGLLSPAFIYIYIDETRKEREYKHFEEKQRSCAELYNQIMLFIFDQASTYTFGTELDPPQNVSDLYGGYDLSVEPGFTMKIRFLTDGRKPIPADKWKKMEDIFQTDFDWGLRNGNLTGTIKVKRFYYSDNAAWLDIEVIP